jgi:anhydro-N-acetylmuramic acid kinase
MLNLGGIANFTYLPGNLDTNGVLVTDTGPGNTLIDAYTQAKFGIAFDRDALLARRGEVSEPLLAELKASEFFNESIPKTTGPERFNLEYLRGAIECSGSQQLSSYDVLATLTRLSAVTIADALKHALPGIASATVYCSGGGAHNSLLMEDLQRALNGLPMHLTDELGIPGDAKEAVLFALLANETIAGEPVAFKQGGCGAISLGKLSFPG